MKKDPKASVEQLRLNLEVGRTRLDELGAVRVNNVKSFVDSRTLETRKLATERVLSAGIFAIKPGR